MADDFGDWIRGEAIREGGQAWTYFAYRKGDARRTPFVLKVLKQKTNPTRLKRFVREIEVGSRLSHPCLVRIEAEDIEAVKPYVVMEYCPGGELQNLDLSQLSIIEKLNLFEKICEGVAHLHKNGVIHRDLKPSNIFLRDPTTPAIGDLGLCLITEQDERLTETSEAVGARLFMAPEFADGRYEDAKPVADIYSLGKTLYWLLSNKRIFDREKHRHEKYDLNNSGPTASMSLVYAVLDGAIKKEPNERTPSDAEQFCVVLRKVVERITAMSHAIDRNVPQDCTYCGEGKYQTIIETAPQEREFDMKSYALGVKLNNVAGFTGHKWLIMACDYCGNLQWFRTDLAKNNPKAWQEGSRP